jgi:hypothetical protein
MPFEKAHTIIPAMIPIVELTTTPEKRMRRPIPRTRLVYAMTVIQ